MVSPTLPGGGAPLVVSPPPSPAASLSHEELQRLVDRSANFHVFAAPALETSALAGDGGQTAGFRSSHPLRRLDIDLSAISSAGVKASNLVGDPCGRLDMELWFIPWDAMARPDSHPATIALDPTSSQRFVMQDVSLTLDGGDGFRGFGAGRTFPVFSGGLAALVVAGVGNVLEGRGRLAGYEGNFTLSGALSPERGFSGHVMIRFVDHDGGLLIEEEIPLAAAAPLADTGATYITYMGQKPYGDPELENRFSFAGDGGVRGLNIPVPLHPVSVAFDPFSFRARRFALGEIVGREIGFGKGSIPGASQRGTPFDPFLFEGVSRYSFRDSSGREVGSLTANVVEGRRFDVVFPEAPAVPALRFGFFGPIVAGSGCFEGVQGILYGASGSVFNLPPGDHVISNWYVARLLDPDGRFRAGR
jgi:hypothetical protein